MTSWLEETKMAIDLQNMAAIFNGDNGTILAVLSAVFVAIFTSVVMWLIARRRNKRNTVLIVGLTDSGKTLLFTRLYYGQYFSTHTSIKENKGSYISKQTKDEILLELIDIPGNEKLRGKFIDKFQNLARGIIFVVDSVNIMRELHSVSQCLFDILSNKTFNKISPKLLIACNKQDLTTAKSMNVIKSQLVKEINTLRKTRGAAVKGLDEQSMNRDEVFLGQKGKDFEFEDVGSMKVEFVECSAKLDDERCDLHDVQSWLNKLM